MIEKKQECLDIYYIKKRTEQEIRKKFNKQIEENMLDDIIEYLKEAGYINDKDYIKRTINNFIALKNRRIFLLFFIF